MTEEQLKHLPEWARDLAIRKDAAASITGNNPLDRLLNEVAVNGDGEDQFTKDLIAVVEACARLLEALADANRALEEARKDSERLDWREVNPRHSFGLYSDGEWADGNGGSHKTYREAIDAAIAARKVE